MDDDLGYPYFRKPPFIEENQYQDGQDPSFTRNGVSLHRPETSPTYYKSKDESEKNYMKQNAVYPISRVIYVIFEGSYLISHPSQRKVSIDVKSFPPLG